MDLESPSLVIADDGMTDEENTKMFSTSAALHAAVSASGIAAIAAAARGTPSRAECSADLLLGGLGEVRHRGPDEGAPSALFRR
jgi:hypothetical protein